MSGDGGIGVPNGITTEISVASRRPRAIEVVVQQQRRLARRRRALERLAGHADDGRAALERGEHVAQRDGARDRVELVAALDEARRRRRIVGRRRARRRGCPRRTCRRRSRRALRPGRSIARCVCTNRTPGFTMSRYGWRASAGICRPNITSSLEKPNTNDSPLSMSTMSIASPNASDRIVVNSRPPKPAPSTTTRVCMACRISVQSGHGTHHRGPRQLPHAHDRLRVRPQQAGRSGVGADFRGIRTRCSAGSTKRSPT